MQHVSALLFLLVMLLGGWLTPAGAFPLKVTDALGRQVTLKAPPQRVVSLAPSNTERLFVVGAGDKVIGVTQYDTYPPDVRALPKVGGFAGKSLSVEKIVSLRPDLVLSAGEIQRPVIEALEQLGVTVVAIEDPRHFADVYDAILLVGRLTGREAQAARVVADMQERVARVREKVAALPPGKRVTVFYEVFDEPLMTASSTSFIGQMIELAGAVNIFAHLNEKYPQVSAEEVVRRNPSYIFGLHSHRIALTPEQMKQRPGWSRVTAVRQNHVYLFDDDTVSRPGPRLVEALETMVRVLYPDLMP